MPPAKVMRVSAIGKADPEILYTGGKVRPLADPRPNFQINTSAQEFVFILLVVLPCEDPLQTAGFLPGREKQDYRCTL